MSIILNGSLLSNLTFNAVVLDKVIYNGVTVFEKVVAPVREPASGEYFQFNLVGGNINSSKDRKDTQTKSERLVWEEFLRKFMI